MRIFALIEINRLGETITYVSRVARCAISQTMIINRAQQSAQSGYRRAINYFIAFSGISSHARRIDPL